MENSGHRYYSDVSFSVSSRRFISINTTNEEIVGHILISKVKISNEKEKIDSLALAPVSVSPVYHNQGIGKLLMREALERAKDLGYSSVIVLGHPHYYPKYGFKSASLWGIKAPFEVTDDVFMVLELHEGALNHVSGVVEYPSVFFE
ncbi:N-acetyltransferase [Paenibacillus sp. GSMTC-2017]|uniref:GNAT family N-acetyltransferase n=1 Tax=Paenibacillus sp. GSMTC-2017 TaxID=2794350 RepID=UPI0018D94173|nr:N-acetyltransferase [Paenibacillus sp. GSMTC-2017]